MSSVELDGFLFKKSKRKDKKYDVYRSNKFIASFGGNPSKYSHYKDKIGLYSHLDTNDDERRRLYFARHGKKALKGSARYFSHTYLWSK